MQNRMVLELPKDLAVPTGYECFIPALYGLCAQATLGLLPVKA
jgi:hypothetical protein